MELECATRQFPATNLNHLPHRQLSMRVGAICPTSPGYHLLELV